jgi:hypothetical protein
MKRKLSLVIVAIAVLALLFWWWWPRDHHVPITEDVRAQKSSTPQDRQTLSGEKNSATVDELTQTPWKGTDQQKSARIAEVREVIHHANQPVRFFGQVIDQDNVPLSGVKVRLSLKRTEETLPGLSHDALDYVDEETDAQGLFSLTGRNGSLLMVQSLVKTGYKAPYVGNRAYWYEEIVTGQKFTPNEAKPEVFRMWKMVGAERLVQKNIGTRIPYDGTSVNFDLQSGAEVKSGGDIRVTLTRTPLQIKRGQQKYDWIATVEAVSGGVIESSDEFMYRAPENGYEPKLTVSVSADAPNWSSEKGVAFYLKSRGGKTYGRVKAEFFTDSEKPTTIFNVEAYTNPSGSRNLEYDSLQDVIEGSHIKPSGMQKP